METSSVYLFASLALLSVLYHSQRNPGGLPPGYPEGDCFYGGRTGPCMTNAPFSKMEGDSDSCASLNPVYTGQLQRFKESLVLENMPQ